MAREPGPTEVVRSRSSQALGVAMMITAVVGLVAAGLDGLGSLADFAGALALFGWLGWAAFWQPLVEVSDGGVRVANTWRTVEVPWPAVLEVEGRYGLRLRTAYGPVTAWSAPAPTGRARAQGRSGTAAHLVRGRLEELRSAGYLDEAVLERPRPRVIWHRTTIAVTVTLLLAAVVLPLLG